VKEMDKIKIERNGNTIEITPDFERKGVSMKINGEQIYGCSLNSKNQYRNSSIGVQLDENQAEQIRNWKNEINKLKEKEDEAKRAEIKNKPVKMLKFKFHNYGIERYMHTESVELSNHKKAYSDEGIEIMNAVRRLTPEQLDKIGIKQEDGVWQEVTLTDEDKKFILEQGAINEAETEKEIAKIEKERKERREAREQKAKAKKAETLKKAIETGKKQALHTESIILNDGNLLLKYTWIHPDGSISTSEFYDGD
jgi:hypothetical protein